MRDGSLHVLMLSVHGLLRGRDPELGRDADTGGQITYVLELARALAKRPDVARVDVVTRRIEDPSVSPEYAVEEETLAPNARIVRLPFGPARYLRKELLWRHLDQLVDRTLEWLRAGDRRLPDLLHSHYADAGYVGTRLSQALAIPLVHTGHSLGRVKRERLLATGRPAAALERQFRFSRRIAAEESVLEHASLVVASTRHEVEVQYPAYQSFDARRCVVIPPGASLSRFAPPSRGAREERAGALLDRFLTDPGKPLILTICRPAEAKNVRLLVKAFGEDQDLRRKANLAIVCGCRDDVRDAPDEPRQVLTELLLDVDRYDLYGQVAIPKRHAQEEIPELYRLAARRRGVFVDDALTEPFGLTLLEAAASGLPVVATREGGPRDIVETCRNGLLVDPRSAASLAAALRQALGDDDVWRAWSRKGREVVGRSYTWPGHAERYVRAADQLLRRERKQIRRRLEYLRTDPPAPRRGVDHAVVADIDRTLVGDARTLEELLRWLGEHRQHVLFGVATGRVLPLALRVLAEWRVPLPDVVISGVGTEIRYGPALVPDPGWSRHIRHGWRREALEEALRVVPGLTLQPESKQGPFKLSFDVDAGRMPEVAEIERLLRSRGLKARLVYSQDTHLDALPIRASKGSAIRYLGFRDGLPPRRFLVAGDSANDEEMLVGDTLGVVVGNHSRELEPLRGGDQIYFAERPFAGGILEGIAHYGFASSGGDAAART